MSLFSVECLRCGYGWMARSQAPKCCPRCKRYDWFKKGVEVV